MNIKNLQLIASTKNDLRADYDGLIASYTRYLLAPTNLHTLLLELEIKKSGNYIFQVQNMIV